MRWKTQSGNVVSSHSSACGRSSLTTKLWIDSRSWSCSSVKMKCLREPAWSGFRTSVAAMAGTVPRSGQWHFPLSMLPGGWHHAPRRAAPDLRRAARAPRRSRRSRAPRATPTQKIAHDGSLDGTPGEIHSGFWAGDPALGRPARGALPGHLRDLPGGRGRRHAPLAAGGEHRLERQRASTSTCRSTGCARTAARRAGDRALGRQGPRQRARDLRAAGRDGRARPLPRGGRQRLLARRRHDPRSGAAGQLRDRRRPARRRGRLRGHRDARQPGAGGHAHRAGERAREGDRDVPRRRRATPTARSAPTCSTSTATAPTSSTPTACRRSRRRSRRAARARSAYRCSTTPARRRSRASTSTSRARRASPTRGRR